MAEEIDDFLDAIYSEPNDALKSAYKKYIAKFGNKFNDKDEILTGKCYFDFLLFHKDGMDQFYSDINGLLASHKIFDRLSLKYKIYVYLSFFESKGLIMSIEPIDRICEIWDYRFGEPNSSIKVSCDFVEGPIINWYKEGLITLNSIYNKNN